MPTTRGRNRNKPTSTKPAAFPSKHAQTSNNPSTQTSPSPSPSPLDTVISTLSQVIESPEHIIDIVAKKDDIHDPWTEQLTHATKTVFEYAASHSPSLYPLHHLHISQFTLEQIWQQVQLQNRPVAEYIEKMMETLSGETEEEGEGDEEDGDEQEERDEMDEDEDEDDDDDDDDDDEEALEEGGGDEEEQPQRKRTKANAQDDDDDEMGFGSCDEDEEELDEEAAALEAALQRELDADDGDDDDDDDDDDNHSSAPSKNEIRDVHPDAFFSIKEMDALADRPFDPEASAEEKKRKREEAKRRREQGGDDDEEEEEDELDQEVDLDVDVGEFDPKTAERYDDFFGPPDPNQKWHTVEEQYALEDEEEFEEEWENLEEEAREEEEEEEGESDVKKNIDQDGEEEEEEEEQDNEPGDMDMDDADDEFIGLKRHRREEAATSTSTSTPTQHLSTYETQQQVLSEQISILEKQLIQPRGWDQRGEITSVSRPDDSLLQQHVSFEHATRPTEPITQHTTIEIEDVIRRRIIDETWDDVVRQIDEPVKRKRVQHDVSDAKSNLGLAEVYEQAYLDAIRTDGKTAVDDATAAKHKEIATLFASLCHQLDAAANFHYTPKAYVEEISIIPTSTPALSMEEIIPMAVSDAVTKAPREIYQSKEVGAPVGQTERTQEERARHRRAKKHAIHQKNLSRDAREKAKTRLHDTTNEKQIMTTMSAKDIEKIKHNKHIKMGKNTDTTKYATSSAFFKQVTKAGQTDPTGKRKRDRDRMPGALEEGAPKAKSHNVKL